MEWWLLVKIIRSQYAFNIKKRLGIIPSLFFAYNDKPSRRDLVYTGGMYLEEEKGNSYISFKFPSNTYIIYYSTKQDKLFHNKLSDFTWKKLE